MDRRSTKILIACLVLTVVSLPAFAQGTLYSQHSAEGGPMGGPYVPAGTLYDNEQSNGTTSLASQDSSGTLTARSADDFTIDGTGCETGVFDITSVRAQINQQNATPQAFGVELYDDNGAGTAPVSGINPIASFAEVSQVNLGAFGATTSIFEAAFDTGGQELNGDTIYWISAFGTDAAQNAAAFNNFFAASAGAAGTTANGVLIAPGAGVADWTPAEAVIGPPALAFSFAIDGQCMVASMPFDPNIPTLSPIGIGVMAGILGLLAIFVIARRRG